MANLPQISGKKLCKAVEKEGFVFVRKKGTLHNILKKTGITREKLVFLLALLMKLH